MASHGLAPPGPFSDKVTITLYSLECNKQFHWLYINLGQVIEVHGKGVCHRWTGTLTCKWLQISYHGNKSESSKQFDWFYGKIE